MAIDFIKITQSTTNQSQTGLLLQYVNVLRTAFELGTRLKAQMDHNQDGSTWTTLESAYGIPSGKGQTVYNFINGSVGSMQGAFQTSDVKNLTENVG